jgi:hypothetical protein
MDLAAGGSLDRATAIVAIVASDGPLTFDRFTVDPAIGPRFSGPVMGAAGGRTLSSPA